METLIASSKNSVNSFDPQLDPSVDRLIKELGIDNPEVNSPNNNAIPGRSGDNYIETLAQSFTADERHTTTILMAGLTISQDMFLGAALRGLGYKIITLDVPDNDALRFGKEFGNRGQCNPTYFTVGNLVKYLTMLRDEKGMDPDDIKNNFLFFTAGACGPCRFGTYVTEYRKALKDSGFEGFRVLTGSQTGGASQAIGEGGGFEVNATLFTRVVTALVLGDVINAMMYRIRPYEVEPGATNKAVDEARQTMINALEHNTSILRASWRCRKIFSRVKVDRSQVKPKVSIIGEFWAMTTEGDGNYHLQKFLESEGAEVDVQLVTAWILYMLWQSQWDTKNRMALKRNEATRRGLAGVNTWKKLKVLRAAEIALVAGFKFFARIIGLKDYQFVDQNELADISHEFYNNDNRGGEGHMEVGKLILNAAKRKVNMTISVKPFGCMPSSGVSDGVQSSITERYPQAIFLPIETTGDGAVNVYSRIQMQLFKAKQAAEKEVEEALETAGMDKASFIEKLKVKGLHQNPLHRSPHFAGCTSADLAWEVANS